MDLISVVVPVFKVEAYLDRCIQSIVSQTYTNLEIILVDDGSPDHCPEKCDDWSIKDNRIKVLHKKNGGLSDARNAGMAIATGKYIAFVDSDDWIDMTMIQKLYDRIQDTGTEISSCGAVRCWDGGKADHSMVKQPGNYILDSQEALIAIIRNTYLIQPVWNKLYKSDLAKEILFEKDKIHEDEFWSWKIIVKANGISTIADDLYFYYQRGNSIMGNGYSNKPLHLIEARYQRYCYIRKNMPLLLDMESYNFIYTCRYTGCIVLQKESKELQKQYFKEMQRYIKHCTMSKSYLRSVSLKKRLRIFLICHNLLLVCRVDTALGKV